MNHSNIFFSFYIIELGLNQFYTIKFVYIRPHFEYAVHVKNPYAQTVILKNLKKIQHNATKVSHTLQKFRLLKQMQGAEHKKTLEKRRTRWRFNSKI